MFVDRLYPTVVSSRQHVSGEGRGTSPPAWEQYRKHQKKCRTQHERDDNDTNDVDRVASGSTPQTRPDDATSKGKGREKENGKKKEKDDGDERLVSHLPRDGRPIHSPNSLP